MKEISLTLLVIIYFEGIVNTLFVNMFNHNLPISHHILSCYKLFLKKIFIILSLHDEGCNKKHFFGISNGPKEIGKVLDDLKESLKSITAPLGIAFKTMVTFM